MSSAVTSRSKNDVLSPLALLELGSGLLFGRTRPEDWMQPPVAATGAAIAEGKMPAVCLPVLAAIAATTHPKDYNTFPARDAAWALWSRSGGTRETLAEPDDTSELATAVRDVVLLTIGSTFGYFDEDTLTALEHLDSRFGATSLAFELVSKPSENSLLALHILVDAAPSASLFWLDEAMSTMRGDRRRKKESACRLDECLEEPERAVELATLLKHSRKDFRAEPIAKLWCEDPQRRDREVLANFIHFLLMTYRQLRGIELLVAWLPRLARAVSRGSS